MSVSITISVFGTVARQLPGIPWQSGMNVQNAMEQAYQSGTGYGFTVQYFGAQLGYEAVSIDNIAAQSGTDSYLFWELSLNGQIAQNGMDTTILSDGDQVGWNYTQYSIQQHAGSRYEAVRDHARGIASGQSGS